MVLLLLLLLLFSFIMYCYIQDTKKKIGKRIIRYLLVSSILQIIWTTAYMLSEYLPKFTISGIVYIIAFYITGLAMFKGLTKLGYLIFTNIVISPILSLIWIRIGDATFVSCTMNSLRAVFIPIAIIVINGSCQISLFIFIKLQNWLSLGKQKEKQPLKKTFIKYIKVLCFQLLLSMVLEVILISNNMFLSCLPIVFFLGAIFIFRKKISVSYIFWIISWLFIDNTAIFLGGKSISSFHMLVRQQLETNCMIGFPIYHILLTIYFKLKGNKK